MKDPELRAEFRKLSARVAAIPPPAHLEAAVMDAFDRAQHRRRPFFAVAAALAASLLVGVVLVRPKPAVSPATVSQTRPVADTQEFYPIPYTPPLQPYERVLVVQTDVPVRALLAAGFQVQTSDPGGSVRADVMLSQDGRPRAIRPLVFGVSDRR